MRTTRYQHPEYLSATDSHVVGQRRLMVENARGSEKYRQTDVRDVTTAEQLVSDFNSDLADERPEIAEIKSGRVAGSSPIGR